MILDTYRRAQGLAPDERIKILTGSHLLGPFRENLGELGADAYLVEPQAKGTCPVLAWAAWEIAKTDPGAVIASLHADHAIQPVEAFLDLVRAGAAAAAETGALFTIAIPPSRPETGYGYIQPGAPLDVPGSVEAFHVRSFVEKPDAETAAEYLEAGYFWNSGIFLWKARAFLDEIRAVAPEIAELFPLLENGEVDEFFGRCPSISVDEAVLERSQKVASLRATFEWDDVGAWESLARTREADSDGNICLGNVHAVDASENIVMTEEGTVVLFGVDGLAVVQRGNTVLVADRTRTPDLKSLLNRLPPEIRDPD